MNKEVRNGLGLVAIAAVVWLIGLSIGSGTAVDAGGQQVAELLTGAAGLLTIGGLIVVAVGLFRSTDR